MFLVYTTQAEYLESSKLLYFCQMLGKFKSRAPRNVLRLTMSSGNSGDEIRSKNVNEMKDLKRWTIFRNKGPMSLDSATFLGPNGPKRRERILVSLA